LANEIEKTGQRMAEALARLHREGTPRSAFPSASSTASRFTAPAARRVVAQRCVCGIFDLEFFDRYEQQASGIYRVVESIRIVDRERGGACAEIGRVLNVDDIRGNYMPCPWCGDNGNMRYHCDCGGVVCGGRVKGNIFHCRASCGQSWPAGHPMHEIDVMEEREWREWKAPARRGYAWQAPQRETSPARLLLPPAKGQR
jgi:hypothetical protein